MLPVCQNMLIFCPVILDAKEVVVYKGGRVMYNDIHDGYGLGTNISLEGFIF